MFTCITDENHDILEVFYCLFYIYYDKFTACVEAGSNTSILALQVVGGDEKGTQWPPCSWGL
jgi:hypothetical protein